LILSDVGTNTTAQKVTSTPLLEYLKARKLDKIRVKEDKINEKKKRELERKKAREERSGGRQGEGDAHPVKVRLGFNAWYSNEPRSQSKFTQEKNFLILLEYALLFGCAHFFVFFNHITTYCQLFISDKNKYFFFVSDTVKFKANLKSYFTAQT